MTVMTMADFFSTFDDFRHQVFRLETLDFYDSKSEREPLERFRAGLSQDPSWLEPWAQWVRSVKRRGASIGRVHVVSEPLTEYIRFEMTCAYPSNIDAGEEIGILPRSVANELEIPERDYWLFDDERVGHMVYDDKGVLRHLEVTTDPATVGECVRLREACQDRAVPLRQYMTEAGLSPLIGFKHHFSEG